MHKTPLLKNFPLNYDVFVQINSTILTWPSGPSLLRHISLCFPFYCSPIFQSTWTLYSPTFELLVVSFAGSVLPPPLLLQSNLSFKTFPTFCKSQLGGAFFHFWVLPFQWFYIVVHRTIYDHMFCNLYKYIPYYALFVCFSSTLFITGTQCQLNIKVRFGFLSTPITLLILNFKKWYLEFPSLHRLNYILVCWL